MLLTIPALGALLVYFIFFWSPEETPATANVLATRNPAIPAFQPEPQTATLEFHEEWYGVTLRGYDDHYRVSTTRTVDEARRAARAFFTSRKAKVVSEDGTRIVFSRGKKIHKYLAYLDTQPPQQIDVKFGTDACLTSISIHYNVAGWHIRTPPNQLRREVLEFQAGLSDPHYGVPTGSQQTHSQSVQTSSSRPPSASGSTEPISVTYRSTRAANWRCNLYTIFHNKQFALVVGTCTLFLSVSLPVPAFSSNGFINVVLRLVLAAVAVGLLNFVLLALAILKRFPTAHTIRTCTSDLTPEGVRDIMPERPRLLSWASITEIREHNGDVHVWSGLSGIFIPRYAFKDLEEARRFAQLALELWHSKGSLWPKMASKPWRST